VRMAMSRSRSPVTLGEVVATLVLAGLGVFLGSFLGALYLIHAPTGPLAPAWSATCIALMAAPIIVTAAAAVRLHAGRVAIYLPLVEFGTIVALMFLIVVLGIIGQSAPGS
jgi:hypothetical protein